jgi:hypothetical protein
MKRVLACALLLTLGCTSAKAPAPESPLSLELQAMLREDQEVRQRWIQDQGNHAIRDEVRTLSKKHVARLEAIVAEHGWPGRTLTGHNGMTAAWTIAQHGGAEVLGRMLPLMYEAVRQRELDESLYATSLDRVRVQRGMKQMYGTQFDVDAATGKCAPTAIEDPEHVDERRVRAGMPTLAEYTKELCEMYLAK